MTELVGSEVTEKRLEREVATAHRQALIGKQRAKSMAKIGFGVAPSGCSISPIVNCLAIGCDLSAYMPRCVGQFLDRVSCEAGALGNLTQGELDPQLHAPGAGGTCHSTLEIHRIAISHIGQGTGPNGSLGAPELPSLDQQDEIAGCF